VFGPDGRLVNVLVASFRLSAYAPPFKTLRLPKDGILGVADRNGTRLFYLPPKETNPLGQPVPPLLWAVSRPGRTRASTPQRAWTACGGSWPTRSCAWTRQPAVHGPVPGLPLDAISAPARAVMIRNLALLAGVALLGLGGAWLLDRAVLGRRLKAVTETAARIQAGDLSARTGLPPSDTDLGLLAQALDSMAQALQERQAEQTQAAEATARSLREKETLLREIHHRVKNNLQLILSLVRLQSLHQEGNPVADFPARMENRVRAMALVHEMLYGSADLAGWTSRATSPGWPRPWSRPRPSRAGCVFRWTPSRRGSCWTGPCPSPCCSTSSSPTPASTARGPDQACGLDVTLRAEGPDLLLRVADTGPGLPPDFDPEQSPSLGLRLVATLAEQLAER
jgi:signal transduction histidine kinase